MCIPQQELVNHVHAPNPDHFMGLAVILEYFPGVM